MILIIFEEKDSILEENNGNPNELSKRHFDVYITIIGILTICMTAPALFFIRDKPPSPPSMVATKSRPV